MYEIRRISHPELWLKETELMELIESEEYQAQLSYYFEKLIQWDGSSRRVTWSDALDSTLRWLNDIIFDAEIPAIRSDVAEWRAKIVEALNILKSREEEESAKFWIAHYSLLASLPYKKIAIRHVKHCMR